MIYDRDESLQKFFNKKFSDIPKVNWRKWLEISSIEEYEDEILRNTGFNSDIFTKIYNENTDPKSLSVNSEIIIIP